MAQQKDRASCIAMPPGETLMSSKRAELNAARHRKGLFHSACKKPREMRNFPAQNPCFLLVLPSPDIRRHRQEDCKSLKKQSINDTDLEERGIFSFVLFPPLQVLPREQQT